MDKNFEQSFRRNIDQATDQESFMDQPSLAKPEFSTELEEYQAKGQEMINSYHKFLMTFAQDVSLDFKMSDGFYIDLEKGEVNLDAKWFAGKGFSRDQILWATLHELAHFRDLAEDPEKMMKNFDYIISQAKKTGSVITAKWEKKYGQSDPDFMENLKKQRPISQKNTAKTMNAIEQSAYKIHHIFYNIFDDIYVNNLVARKAPKYEAKTKGGEEITKLYSEKLFAESDYSKLPRHLQFLYQLFRKEMIPDEAIILSEEMSEVMERKIEFQGREYTPQEIVEEFIKPKKKNDNKAGERYFILQKTLEPIFEGLLMKDLAEWDPEKQPNQTGENGQGEEESANPFPEDYQEYDQNNPDQLNEQDIKDWLDKHQEDKKQEARQQAEEQMEESKSSQDKAESAQFKMDQQWCEQRNISYQSLKQYRKIEEEVAPYLEDLAKLWQRIIFGSTKRIIRGMEGYFKTGTELDIQKTIEQWPQITKGKFEETRLFKKATQKESLIKQPELIRVRLVGDMSGSMDAAKKYILWQCFVLLLSSFREFNTHLNLTRSQTKSKLSVDTQAWIFNDTAQIVKNFRDESGTDDEQAETIKVFEKLKNPSGSTQDNEPLQAIADSLTAEDRKKISQKKIMEMVFEITDGGSSSPGEARQAVDQLAEAEVIVRSFQIGAVSDDDKQIFNNVWNKNRSENLGEIVGEDIKNLLPAITETLKKYLSGVKL